MNEFIIWLFIHIYLFTGLLAILFYGRRNYHYAALFGIITIIILLMDILYVLERLMIINTMTR